MSEMLLSAAENTETAAEGESSWTQTIAAMFEQQWWVFLITLAVVIGVMLLIKILTKGKVFKFRTIIKVALNCIIAFVLLFIINTIGSLFGFALIPKWYSWLFIGLFGILAIIFLFVAYFVWPGKLTA
ncbi:MAG TPA: hypothetical protein H9692_04630 [Firmicutes bacterium]|nr:hypothetical protein [Bacillota bacterium]